MKNIFNKKIWIVAIPVFLGLSLIARAQTINSVPPLDPWTSTTTPSASITQRTYGKAIQITGLTNGECLGLNSNNIVVAMACSGGGGGGSTFGTTSISALYPLSWNTSTAQMSFNGLSTSTTPTLGNLPFFTSSNTFGSVATTSVSCSGTVSCSPFTAIGASPITLTGSASGGGSGTWATTTSQTSSLINYSLNNTDIVTVGGNSTSSAKFIFDPNSQIGYFSGDVGIQTKSPNYPLEVYGTASSSSLYGSSLATCNSAGNALTWASGKFGCATGYITSAITSLDGLTGASQTFATTSNAGGWGFSAATTIHTLNIPKQDGTQALGLLSAADWTTFNNKGSGTVTSVTGTSPIQVSAGATPNITFTGLATTSPLVSGQVLFASNGTSGVGNEATGTITCSGEASCGAGSYVLGNNLTITSTNAGVTSIKQTNGSAQTGAITIGTSTQSFNGLTLGNTITNSSGTFTITPLTSGTLNNSGLTNSSVTVNNTAISLGSSGTITAASSTLLSDNNTFSGTTTTTGLTFLDKNNNSQVLIGTSTEYDSNLSLDVGGMMNGISGTIDLFSGFHPVASFSTSTSQVSGISMANTDYTDTASDFRFLISDSGTTTGNYISFDMPGKGNTATLFGQTRSNIATVFTQAVGSANGRILAVGTVNNNDFLFGTDNTERMRLTAAGNLGIGFSAPQDKLDVNGLASSTNLFAAASSTLQNFTALNSTSSNATTTNFSNSTNDITIGGNYVTSTTTASFNIASTTLDALGKSFSVGTTTLLLRNSPTAIKLLGFYCVASTTGTIIVDFSHDNGNITQYSTCTSGSYTSVSTNNTWTAFEDFNVQASSTAGVVNRVTVTAEYVQTAP